MEACFIALGRNDRAEWILEGDIRSCFDELSHNWLLAHTPMDKTILRKWLKAGYLEHQRFHPTEAGTPQGGICSPVIATMALDGLERLLAAHFPKRGKAGKHAKVNLIRYADDFVITGASQDLLEWEVKPLVEAFLRERGLELSPEKTVITHIEQGFDLLSPNGPQIPLRRTHQVLHHPVEEERQKLAPAGKETHQGKPRRNGRRADCRPQPPHWGLGDVPSPRGEQSRLPCHWACHLPGPVGLGAPKTPPQIEPLD
jgi:hypothetical protein